MQVCTRVEKCTASLFKLFRSNVARRVGEFVARITVLCFKLHIAFSHGFLDYDELGTIIGNQLWLVNSTCIYCTTLFELIQM